MTLNSKFKKTLWQTGQRLWKKEHKATDNRTSQNCWGATWGLVTGVGHRKRMLTPPPSCPARFQPDTLMEFGDLFKWLSFLGVFVFQAKDREFQTPSQLEDNLNQIMGDSHIQLFIPKKAVQFSIAPSLSSSSRLSGEGIPHSCVLGNNSSLALVSGLTDAS